MGQVAVPEELSTAISELCSKEVGDLHLMEVLEVAEIMTRSLKKLFTTADNPLYGECLMLAAYLTKARTELEGVRPMTLRDMHLPTAKGELEEIRAHTEEATNTIMESAETILSTDAESVDDYQGFVTEQVLKIFEACSFQDITGQRAEKVATVLRDTGHQFDSVINALGESHEERLSPKEETEEERRVRENLLHGPAASDEAIDQDEVDELISQDDIDSLFD